MPDEPAPKKPWHAFWNFNVGHVLILAGMIGSAWVVVNNVEVTLADHAARINKLEEDVTKNQRATSDQYERISQQLTDLAREVSRLQGQMMLLIPPQRRGDRVDPDNPMPDGG